jgi:UrcA family protein
MNSQAFSGRVVVSRPKVTLMMILCGVVGAVSAGAVSAATTDDEVPRIVVKYDPASLSDVDGARALYQRIVRAAAQVCPIENERYLRQAQLSRECREQSIARAVHQINNPRLAEVYSSHTKRA